VDGALPQRTGHHMPGGPPSRTAEQDALLRALESARPEGQRLFHDPLARAFLGQPLALVAALGSLPGVGAAVSRLVDWRWPGLRTAAAARTRLIDEAVTGALSEPVEQLVLLGAGFDSRAYRLHGARRASVFEVDQPDPQRVKRVVLARVLSAPAAHVRFVPTDVGQRELEAGMRAAGYREAARTFFLWEGVTEAAVDVTLRWCARAAAGSQLLFTYVHVDALRRAQALFGAERLFGPLARAGERPTFGMDPTELPAFLGERGLTLERDVGAAEYRQRYFGDAARLMRGHEFHHVAQARVSAR